MKLKIKDIKHTGHHGPNGESKVGLKYDKRRDCYFNYNPKEWKIGHPVFLILEKYEHIGLLTTPLVDQYFSGENEYIIQTENSYYICEVLNCPDRFAVGRI